MTQVKFDISNEDRKYVNIIIDRACALKLVAIDIQSSRMDLIATHANGCPMDFKRMAEADDFNFTHDFCGIANRIDRTTGKLTLCFLPRFARKQNRGSEGAA